MPQFRKKPVVIEAVRVSDLLETDGKKTLPPWVFDATEIERTIVPSADYNFVTIKTMEGDMRGDFHDWIIKGVAGEIYPCKPEIFEATYEPVDSNDKPADDIPPSLRERVWLAARRFERANGAEELRDAEAAFMEVCAFAKHWREKHSTLKSPERT